MAALFIRIKMEGGMDASDSLRAQDGRMAFEYQGRPVDLRLASQPIAGGETLTMRVLDPESMPSLDSMFPAQPDMIALIQSLAQVHGKNGGLIFVSGPTGSGKTTTLYAIAQRFARDRVNVVTVEDPVEYMLPFARQIQINQLLNQKTADVERSILRQDPDVILVGELRDLETMEAAITAAETGHLVFGTLHTTGAAKTIDRIVNAFPQNQQEQIRIQLSTVLQAVISQLLVPRVDKPGRVAVFEVMVNTPSVGALIRDNKTFRIQSDIQTGAKYGMVTLDSFLLDKWQAGLISEEDVVTKAQDPTTIHQKLQELKQARAEAQARRKP
jgi:pilus retraction protein PilT